MLHFLHGIKRLIVLLAIVLLAIVVLAALAKAIGRAMLILASLAVFAYQKCSGGRRNLLAGLSLLMCLATVVFWVRSYSHADWWIERPHTTQTRAFGVLSSGGKIEFLREPVQPPPRSGAIAIDPDEYDLPYAVLAYLALVMPAAWYVGKFGRRRAVRHSVFRRWATIGVVIPLAVIVAAVHVVLPWFLEQDAIAVVGGRLLGLFGLWLIALFVVGVVRMAWQDRKNERQARQLREGICIHCDYDLRATPDKCPECGTVPDKPSKSST